ncbi:unnamed protein product [Didymodactylos carnosus]|uniref:Protein kinase domain-containing protein n=1 Tax=Didymodactylos carnosus TaxID=1234261 RepID=A0A813Q9P8_9BILA|nr:unnamed protein product [Didymodactylos carnosus]CAF3544983.1 unnamed protein product [Didymodactylos carnosus]
MEYLEKLKVYGDQVKNVVVKSMVDTVLAAQGTMKDVLPGNLVTREFDLIRPLGSAGPGLLWRIYAALKRTTKQEAAVFVFEKRVLDKYPKKDRDLIIETMKKGVQQLAKIKHPRILSLQHPLEESRDSLAFATESCFGSLSNALGFYDNMTQPIPKEFEDFKLYDVEMRFGLSSLCEGLTFLHNEVKLLHRNISPDTIIINSTGAWKLAFFDWAIQGSADGTNYPFRDYDCNVPALINPRLDYMAPEYVLTRSYDTQADMFSLGVLIYAIYNRGRTLNDCHDNYSNFRKMVDDLKLLNTTKLSNIPLEVREHVKMLLNPKPELRPDASQFVPFFDEVGVKTLEYLDSLFQVDNLQRSMFYKSLPQVIEKLPMRVNLQRIASALELEFVNPDMVPFVLPNMFLIAEKATNEEYQKYIFPKLKQVFKIQRPVQGSATSGSVMQVLLVLMRNMNLMLTKTPPEDIKQHILPVVYNALDAESVQVQELCLAIIPSFAHLIDLQAMKYSILPRIKTICYNTITLSVRVNSLICLGKLVETLDKWIIIDEVLPLLQSIPSREPAVLMAILGIIKVAMTSTKAGNLPREVLATKIVPFLVPMSIETSLSLNQFNAFMITIKEMLQTIEVEQRKKLEQLSSQTANAPIIPIGVAVTNNNEQTSNKSSSMMDQFMMGYGFNTEISQNRSMSETMYGSNSDRQNGGLKFQDQTTTGSSTSSTSNTIADNSISKKALTLEQKERIMRENDQSTRLKTQPELVAEKKNISPSKNMPLMSMTPLTSSTTSSSITKDLTSTLFDSNISNLSSSSSTSSMKPSAFPMTMTTSQTLPYMQPFSTSSHPPVLTPGIRPMIPQQQSVPREKRPHFSTTSANSMDLTSSLMNNINSLSMNSSSSSSSMSLNQQSMAYSNSGGNSFSSNIPANKTSNAFFPQPPAPGSNVMRGHSSPSPSSTTTQKPKTTADEIADFFN